MAITISAYGPNADKGALPWAGPGGNLSVWHGSIELASAAQNAAYAVIKVPYGVRLYGYAYHHDAMGSTTGLKFGLQTKDGSTISDDDLFATVADASTAGSAIGALALTVEPDQDCYVLVKQTGAGTATGTVEFQVFGEWIGHA